MTISPRSVWRAVGAEQWTPGGAAALVGVALVLLAAFGGLLGAFDLDTMLRAGHRVLQGTNPYDSTTSAVFLAGHAFVYPAFVAWLFAPLAALPHAFAAGLYIVASVAAIVAACGLLGRPGFSPAALVLTSSAAIVGLQMGTVNAWLLLGLAVAWRQRDRWGWLAGIVLGSVVAVKLFLLPMLAWPVIARRYGAAAAGAGTFALLMAISTVGGPISFGTYRHLLSSLSVHEVAESWSLASLVQGLGAPSGVATAVAVVAAAAVLAATWRSADRLGEARVAAIALLACLIMSPIVWSSYLLLLVLPLLLATRGNAPLILASALSWAIVVPDVAPALNLVAGIALLAVVAAHAGTDELRGLAARIRRSTAVERAGAGAAVVVLVVVLAVVPPGVRNALPTLLGIAALLVVAARPQLPAASPEVLSARGRLASPTRRTATRR